MFYGLGLGFNCISVFLNPLMESINVSNTLRSSVTIFYQSGSVLALLITGQIINKIGARETIFISGLCMAGGYILLALSKSILPCYLAMLVIGVGYGAGAIVPCSLLLTIWFSEKKGFALGIAACGSGVATIFFPSVLNNLINLWGVQKVFGFQAGIIAALSAAAFLILRNNPEELGLNPYGERAKDYRKKQEDGTSKLRDAFKNKAFLMMALAIISVGIIVSPVVTHMSPIISQSGYGAELAAEAVSVYGLSMLIGKPVYGSLIDKLGVRKSNVYIYSLLGLALLAGLMAGESSKIAFAFAILFGIGGTPVITIGLPVWTAELFGKNSMGNLFAILKLCSSLGGTLGAAVPGIIIDNTGSYTDLFKIYLVAAAVSFAILQFLFRKEKLEND